ncbi:MAG: DUF3822 family protein [Prevotellaceae bacterium]|jgi:hypothetical protein|nr:DUF3822 family protein [Prevotellaceae bacterium]
MLLNFVDRSFDIKRLIHYRLSIQISLNGFSFSVFDEGLSKHVILRDYQYQQNITNYEDLSAEIGSLSASDDCLALDYPVCTCLYISLKHTLIPENSFSKEKLRTYMEFVSPLEELDEIHYYKYPATDTYSIYVIPSLVASKLTTYYKKIRFINQANPLICGCLKNTEGSNILYINLHNGVADMVLAENKQLKLHNAFEIYHLNDAVYYITALLHQFQLKLQTTPIYISGDVMKEEIEELTKYFPLLKINNNHRMSMLVGQENSYRYFNLLTAHECE